MLEAGWAPPDYLKSRRRINGTIQTTSLTATVLLENEGCGFSQTSVQS